MGRTEGKNGSFMAIRMRIHQNCSSSMTPQKKLGPEAMPKFLIVVWPICSVTVLRGTHWVPWCILKPDIYGYNISAVLFSCFKKFKCLGDVLASVSLPEFAKLRSQLLDVFIISSDFDLAQHFSCSVKTVECGQLFILACGQLRKKAQHNFIGQFKIFFKVPSLHIGLAV